MPAGLNSWSPVRVACSHWYGHGERANLNMATQVWPCRPWSVRSKAHCGDGLRGQAKDAWAVMEQGPTTPRYAGPALRH